MHNRSNDSHLSPKNNLTFESQWNDYRKQHNQYQQQQNQLFKEPALNELPAEIINKIAAYGSFTDVLNLRKTCHFFKDSVQSSFSKQLKKQKFIKEIFCSSHITFFLCQDGSLYVCGYSREGALGLGDISCCYKPTYIPDLPPVKMIAAGSDHTLVLCEDNTLWGCGSNKYRQLGFNPDLIQRLTQFTLLNIQGLTTIKSIYVNDYGSFVVCDDGATWAFGSNADGCLGIARRDKLGILSPVRIPNLPPIKMVASHYSQVFRSRHTVFISQDDQAFVCGYSASGALGLSKHIHTPPILVPNLPPIETAAAGERYSIFLCKDGSVWTCGYQYAAIGMKSKTDLRVPTCIPNLPPIKAIASNGDATLFLSKIGDVFVCGEHTGYYGGLARYIFDGFPETRVPKGILNTTYKDGNALGLQGIFGRVLRQIEPRRIPNLPPINAIAMGCSHSIFLGEDNRVFSCGYNEGQLGLDHDQSKNIPTPVNQFNQWVDFLHPSQEPHDLKEEKVSRSCAIM